MHSHFLARLSWTLGEDDLGKDNFLRLSRKQTQIFKLKITERMSLKTAATWTHQVM